MPQTSRTERRHGGRAGAPPPQRKDPMRSVYIGLGVLVVLVFVIFGIVHRNQQREIDAAVATPSPLPSSIPTSKPVQVYEDQTIGKSMFPRGNTAHGGHGQTVDGVDCAANGMEYGNYHIHTHLAILDNGKGIAVPELIGFSTSNGGCLYWIHTHNKSGVIHVESPVIQNPVRGGPFTLGDFFDIWGEPLGPAQVATFKGPVTAYVNGAKYDGNLHDIPLLPHQRIVLEIGKTVEPPPNYLLPPSD